jgi:hypothetical protein
MSDSTNIRLSIARETIPWLSTVTLDTCTGCERGFTRCGQDVHLGAKPKGAPGLSFRLSKPEFKEKS